MINCTKSYSLPTSASVRAVASDLIDFSHKTNMSQPEQELQPFILFSEHNLYSLWLHQKVCFGVIDHIDSKLVHV